MKTQKGETTLLAVLGGSLIALALVLSNLLGQFETLKDTSSNVALGSVTVSNEYLSTTTSTIAGAPSIWRITATSSTDNSSHTGTFGSFVQTAAGTAGGNINIYDATTSNRTLRWPQATSSILLASLPTNATVGTYTFDVEFKRGLLVVVDGTVGTTTITYRP